ncbi:MAG: DNA-directed RNA polymerase [Candidatus Altiarchaeales archaeon HGW-Altiarchaeales-1]|nr:MAG: DNA-directed RNA polymerase [Candidatus Altiarchaeales archaeon HGW-Altiarchaeales-1]
MYYLITAEDFIRVPAERLGKNIENVVYSELERELSKGVFETDSNKGVIVAIEKIDHIGEGKIIPGDGGVYFDVKFTAVADVPANLEFVRGHVKSIMEFGVFIDIGTLDGLCHISQVFDDYASYDGRNKMIVGKETGKKLMVGDEVKARINAISWRGDVLNTKIGLTMRQPYLGKDEWTETDKKIHEKEEKMKEKEKESKSQKEDVKKGKDEKKDKKK